MKKRNLFIKAAAQMLVLLMLVGLCACNSYKDTPGMSGVPAAQWKSPAEEQYEKPVEAPQVNLAEEQQEKAVEGFDLLGGYWISVVYAYSTCFDGEMYFEKDGTVKLNRVYDGTWRIEDGLLYIDDGGVFRGEACYEFECDGRKSLTLRYMSGTEEEEENTYCHRPNTIASTTLHHLSQSDAEFEKLYQELPQKLVGDWENIRFTLDYYWDYLRIRSDGSISVQAGATTYDTNYYFDEGYFCFVTDGFENKYTLVIDGDYMTIHTDAAVTSFYDAYYNKVAGETEGPIIPSGTHMYYAPEDFDESTATTQDVVLYLDGKWRPENGVSQANFPDFIEIQTWTTSEGGQNYYDYVVYLNGEKDRGTWLVRDGKIGFSFDSVYTQYYTYELSGERLTLSRSFTDGSSGSVTYIRD